MIFSSKCEARPGVRLWNRENWQYAPLNLRLDDSFADWLAGGLSNNRHDRALLFRYLGITDTNLRQHTHPRPKKRQAVDDLDPVPDMTIPRMLLALCDLDPRPLNDRDADSVPLGPDGFEGVTSNYTLSVCVRGVAERPRSGGSPWGNSPSYFILSYPILRSSLAERSGITRPRITTDSRR
ncbi:hypothetical protein EXIGLDRAFT_423803 [Exidia glandulosa HHB12029]|uniref:Uncharacterized protein n=1 Tax=Exidia glandulosa HHB12029 TaxID=1314781 RepID=A0A165KJW0_EXIGL|nr:hypothetical protein EXIGLDRAFT_423803 [Exidia glandulosa HHB12029]